MYIVRLIIYKYCPTSDCHTSVINDVFIAPYLVAGIFLNNNAMIETVFMIFMYIIDAYCFSNWRNIGFVSRYLGDWEGVSSGIFPLRFTTKVMLYFVNSNLKLNTLKDFHITKKPHSVWYAHPRSLNAHHHNDIHRLSL